MAEENYTQKIQQRFLSKNGAFHMKRFLSKNNRMKVIHQIQR